MRYFFILLLPLLGFPMIGNAQESVSGHIVDRHYLEDQFYVGLTYNFLMDLPANIARRNLSYGLHGGFIKDIPLNLDRNVGLGIGLGYGVNSYYSNLKVLQGASGLEYSIMEDHSDYLRNKVETHLVELPLEFRWRNSTPEEYKFWRIYAGMKFSYVFANQSKFVSNTEKINFTNADIRKFHYGLTMSVGYNTFNIHVYYALQSLFEEHAALATGEQIKMRPVRVGLIFYIL